MQRAQRDMCIIICVWRRLTIRFNWDLDKLWAHTTCITNSGIDWLAHPTILWNWLIDYRWHTPKSRITSCCYTTSLNPWWKIHAYKSKLSLTHTHTQHTLSCSIQSPRQFGFIQGVFGTKPTREDVGKSHNSGTIFCLYSSSTGFWVICCSRDVVLNWHIRFWTLFAVYVQASWSAAQMYTTPFSSITSVSSVECRRVYISRILFIFF